MADVVGSALAVEQEIRIEAPRERVFALLTEEGEMARWLPQPRFESRIGGRFGMQTGEWSAVGEVVALDPPRRVAYTWDWENAPLGARTEVSFDLEEDGAATIVRLRHTGFASEEQAASHDEGWRYYGERLAMAGAGGDPGPDRHMDAS
ncbi:MAG TPA: SRPBCC family protein [Gaiellaceae bacterium]|nr:SRPBCC family protein [Gaiellaceae bacterium]